MVFYIFRVVRLVLIIIIISYFLGSFWYFVSWRTSENFLDNPEDNFYLKFGLNERSDLYSSLTVTYFSFTTLSTVGYGDLHPRSDTERIIAWFVLLVGVAVFSFIMGNFIEILMSYKQLASDNDNSEELAKWMGLLARYSPN